MVCLSNRLRSRLWRYYPAALEVFSDLTTQIVLHFLQAYPTPQAAALTLADFQAFARQHRYPHPMRLVRCYARLQTPQPQAAPEIVAIYQGEVCVMARLLLQIVRLKNQAIAELRSLAPQHPDYPIFRSLPGAGDLLAPGLLVKFGDDRQRFPSPGSVQALAGTCPVTRSSGRRKVVAFRHACDREFRQIAIQWARCSLRHSVWANAYYERVRPHCRSDSHAYRCLANRWLAIAWKLWQTGEVYDGAYHLRQWALRNRPRR